MGIDAPVLLSFNRGMISRLALARVDLKRTALSAEEQTNYVPRVLGSMMLRPGWQYIGASKSNAFAKYIPFIFATDDTALIEVTNLIIRVRNGSTDELVERVTVSSSTANGTFAGSLSSWADADDAGASSQYVTGDYMGLIGTGFNSARRRQEVAVIPADVGARHALRVVVERGPVTLRVGSTAGDDDFIGATSLGTGTHSLAFTPTGNFHIELSNAELAESLVTSIRVEAPGVMELPAPWLTADLGLLRWAQSGDVVFVACAGYQQRRIERRAADSWSITLYQPADGPFRVENTGPVRLSADALSGDVTLTASDSLFQSGHVGALFRLTSVGQQVEVALTAEAQFSDAIRVTGTGTGRAFTIDITGTWSANIRLQRSVAEPGNWVTVQTYTTNQSGTTYNDGLDNQIIYYRIGIPTGDYTSGSADATLTYATGSITGVVRITEVTDETTASAMVLSPLGGTTANDVWAEGAWSDYRGWPSSVAFYEGRLWWAGQDKIFGSISDAFDSFDPDFEGDAGPISRSIGSGPVDTINWILPLQQLLLGGQGAEFSARSTSLDEPLSPTNFNLKEASTQGSAAIAAVKVDTSGIFVQRSGTRVYELGVADRAFFDYGSGDLTALVPEIGEPSIRTLAVQRQPDTRVHCVRTDGKVAMLVTDQAEEVRAWVLIETDGEVEDVAILPGTGEDRVYYSVKRTINGSTVRYLEKWALESECRGETVCKLADSFVVYDGSPTTTLTAAHLVGESVVVWADGACLADADGDIATFTVSDGGTITVPDAVSDAVIGLPYDARFKSAKLAYAADVGTGLGWRGKVDRLGLILADTHAKGVKYGPSFDYLDDMPGVEDGADVDPDYVWDHYDKPNFNFPGEWSADSRICLKSSAPRPCTVLAIPFVIEKHGRF